MEVNKRVLLSEATAILFFKLLLIISIQFELTFIICFDVPLRNRLALMLQILFCIFLFATRNLAALLLLLTKAIRWRRRSQFDLNFERVKIFCVWVISVICCCARLSVLPIMWLWSEHWTCDVASFSIYVACFSSSIASLFVSCETGWNW